MHVLIAASPVRFNPSPGAVWVSGEPVYQSAAIYGESGYPAVQARFLFARQPRKAFAREPAGRAPGAMARLSRAIFWTKFSGWTMAEAAGVKENVKRVFYVRFLNHPIYLDLIAQRPEIRLDKLENDSPDTLIEPDHRRGARLPGELGARRTADAVSRHQGPDRARAEPADRLHRRRRLRHRQRQGLHRRRRAGGQPDRRQRRRGRRARARRWC